MRAGSLRRKIDIQQPSTAQDSFGAPSDVWGNFAPGVRAEILDLTGRELLAAQSIVAEVTSQITIRFHPGVTAKMRAVSTDTYGTETYNILAAITDPKRRQTKLLCRKLDPSTAGP